MDAINLVKAKAETMTVNLAKKGITTIPPLRVFADLDVSGSMHSLYQGGVVEAAFQQLLGLAFKFDDNGEIEVFAFDNNAHELPVAKVQDYGSYVTRNITRKWDRYGGGTSYGRPIQANLDAISAKPAQAPRGGIFGGMFGKKPQAAQPATQDPPALVLFFTDGEPSDGHEAERMLEEAEGQRVYFHLIGVGHQSFPTLNRLADRYDNCGFIPMKSIDMSDDELYSQLTTDEFVSFLRQNGAA